MMDGGASGTITMTKRSLSHLHGILRDGDPARESLVDSLYNQE
jgi:hypothetical protein